MKTALGHHWDISTADRWGFFTAEVKKRMAAGTKTVVQFVDQDRTLDQNAMVNGLYRQIAAQKDDETFNDIRRHCKAYHGIPILLEHDPAFAEMYRAGIMQHLTTEEKLRAMDILPVTSRMKKPQCSEYIDTVIREYSQQGYSLVHPSEAASYDS